MGAVEEVLEHYGVRGMHWGIRNNRKGSSGPQAPEAKVNPQTGQADLSRIRGGKGFGPSDDAKAAARSLTIAKGSGTKALSNHELQALNTRLQMEKAYVKNVPKKEGRVKRGQNFTKTLLSLGKTLNEVSDFANSNVGRGISGVLRGKNSTSGGKHIKEAPGLKGMIDDIRGKHAKK